MPGQVSINNAMPVSQPPNSLAGNDSAAIQINAHSPPLQSQSTQPQSFLSPPSMQTQSPTLQPQPQTHHQSQHRPERPPISFTWGVYSGQEMFDIITSTYDEVIHWKHNLFQVPSGGTGCSFVKELARLLQGFADGSSLECVCMKAVTLLQILLLQKPNSKSKTKDHVIHLKRRLTIWYDGNIKHLLEEGRCIQRRIPKGHKATAEQSLARTFSNLMAKGKVKNALRLLDRSHSGGVLDLNDLIPESGNAECRSVRDVLVDKHPASVPPSSSSLLQDEPEDVNPIIYDNLTADSILNAAMKTHGAAGLSGLDAYSWRRMCSSFKSASHDLCKALAAVARRICSVSIHPEDLSAFVACRLIPLDKCPGVRPIGIGEVPRRIIAKAVLHLFRLDIQEAAGPLQVCAGQDGGCEAAVHAMRHLFVEEDIEGVLLVDASNAFNSINRQAALHNIRIICPPVSQVLANTYQAPVRCVIRGSGEITSSEGTTQGDPLAMAMYALAVKPLIYQLKSDSPNVKQVWFADDATGAASCSELRSYWDSLLFHGADYGYNPNAAKTHLIVKEKFEEEAKQLFAGTGVNISTTGKRHLGAAIGSRSFVEEYVGGKVQRWVEEIKQLANIAITQPHVAYAAFTHGLSSRWTYLSRTLPDITDLLQPIEDAIHQLLIPALTGRPPCSREERDLLALPVRLGGLGLINPASNSPFAFQASVKLTAPLKATIAKQELEYEIDYSAILEIKKDIRKTNRDRMEHLANEVYGRLSSKMKRCVDLAKEKGTSSWLSVLPLKDQGLLLHKGEFRDALCLRYGWNLPNTPTTCNCGSAFSIGHAMVCHMGGFPTIRHNEIRDLTASLLTEVCHNVAAEPHLQPLNGETMAFRSAITDDGARLDIRARGFWNAAQDAFFDVRVFYPNAPSNRSSSITAAYRKHENDKKRAYGQRVREVEHGVFTPLVLSSTGGMGREATTFF